jgi:hypothetical protein
MKYKQFRIQIVLIMSLAVMFLAVPKTKAAILYTGSANQVVYTGESFVMEWYLDTQGKDVNSLSLVLTYSKDKLEVVNTSVGSSFVDLWVKTPVVDAENGNIQLIGGVSSGVNNRKLSIFRATFRPIETGSAKISLGKESDVLQADGLGTSVGVIFNEMNFTIQPAENKPATITSSSHPDQDAWYKNRNVELKVSGKEGEEYSHSFSTNIETVPDQLPDDIKAAITYHDLPDGVYYFKLNSRQGPSNWQEAGVYRVQIDTTPPEKFKPAVTKDDSVFEGQPFISFNTVDNVSGVSHYEVRTLFGGWKKTEDTYFKLPGLVLGDTIEVKVVDAAGNERIETIQVDKDVVKPVFLNPFFWVIITIALVALILLLRFYLKLIKKYKVNDN